MSGPSSPVNGKGGGNGRLLLLGVLLVVLVLVVQEERLQRPMSVPFTTSGRVELCLFCHGDVRLEGAHEARVVGCSSCHLGDPLAFRKETAHAGVVKNPGDLRVVEQTCGTPGCHSADIHKVKNSLMATNRGILATLLYYWGEAPDQNGDFSVEQLLATGETSLARDYFRKLCGTCHLWKQKGDLPGFFGEKGGGCVACHEVKPPADAPVMAGTDKRHPLLTKKIPSENCIRCHNRSGRIGLSYTGRFEAEGYGTPYEKGKPSANRLPGGRFYLELPADVHYEKGMVCIDCHTREETMGDGVRYAHYEEQLEIRCVTCHGGRPLGVTRKGKKLNNVLHTKEGPRLQGKLDGKKRPLASPKAGVCDVELHRRLSCEACHSAWVPQCYGCHVRRDLSETDRDKLTGEQTPGWWSEGRSFIRYEAPMLAVWDDEVVVVTPGCQDMVTLLDAEGQPERQFSRLTMAAINPHTTRRRGRACQECHADPKTLGLGAGTVWIEDGRWRFAPIHQGEPTPTGDTPPLDAYVAIDGTPLQNSSRPTLRPFNGRELARILRVGLCLQCHDGYRYFRNYTPESSCPDEQGRKALQGVGDAAVRPGGGVAAQGGVPVQ